MAVIIDVRQDKRRNSNQLWYGHAKSVTIIDTNGLADRIQQNVSVKRSDVLAVLAELAEVMSYELSNSNKVQIDNFGYFYNSVNSSGALEKDGWSIPENLKKGTIRFTPFYKRNTEAGGKGVVSRSLTGTGFKYVVLDLEEKKKAEEEGE